jgi:hypothetical protein
MQEGFIAKDAMENRTSPADSVHNDGFQQIVKLAGGEHEYARDGAAV